MAETHFFMTRNDAFRFTSFLIDLADVAFVPERSVDSPPFPRYTTLDQIQSRMECDNFYSRFFVVSRQWEQLPLVINEIHANDGRHFFAVSPRYGGPAFDFILSRTFTEADSQWIVPGSFSDYSYYIQDDSFHKDYSLYRSFDRPEEMTAAHNEVRKYVRKNGCRSICRETGLTGPWILSGAIQEFESGTWLRIGKWHFEPKSKVQEPRRMQRHT